MKIKIVCPYCHGISVMASKPTKGQHLRCSVCGRKFEYRDICEFKEELTSEDLETAIQECMKDPAQRAYYKGAAYQARMLIGLSFYGKVFKHRLNEEMFFNLVDEVLPRLTLREVRYLLLYESNPAIIVRLKNTELKLTQRLKDAEPERYQRAQESAAVVVRPQTEDEAPWLVRAPEFVDDTPAEQEEDASFDVVSVPERPLKRSGGMKGLYYVLIAVLSAVCGGLIMLGVERYRAESLVAAQGELISREAALSADERLQDRLLERLGEMGKRITDLEEMVKRDMDDLDGKIEDVESDCQKSLNATKDALEKAWSARLDAIRQGGTPSRGEFGVSRFLSD